MDNRKTVKPMQESLGSRNRPAKQDASLRRLSYFIKSLESVLNSLDKLRQYPPPGNRTHMDNGGWQDDVSDLRNGSVTLLQRFIKAVRRAGPTLPADWINSNQGDSRQSQAIVALATMQFLLKDRSVWRGNRMPMKPYKNRKEIEAWNHAERLITQLYRDCVKFRDQIRTASSLPMMKEVHADILEALKLLGSESQKSRKTASEIAKKAIGTSDENKIKVHLSWLKKKNYVASKDGRSGGSWILPKGLEALNRYKKEK